MDGATILSIDILIGFFFFIFVGVSSKEKFDGMNNFSKWEYEVVPSVKFFYLKFGNDDHSPNY